MKKFLLLAIASTLFAFAAAPPQPTMGKQESRYMSRVADVDKTFDIQVSTVMRSYTKKHDYLPLIVQVHNWTADNVTVTPDQFTLRSKDGKTLKPISHDEYLANHRVQGNRNYKYLGRRADTGIINKPDIWYIENTRFYPGCGTGQVYDRVNLRAQRFMVDWLYFPNTDSGDYELVFASADGQEMVMPVAL